jgi:hypothetical protein
MKIIVNDQEHELAIEIPSEEASSVPCAIYSAVVLLAKKDPALGLTVTYRGRLISGVLTSGQIIPVEDGMVFEVGRTGYQPLTSDDSAALPEAVKLATLKVAKGDTWYDGWKPYCGPCPVLVRMIPQEYGFECPICRNRIGFDLHRLVDSPLSS